MSQQLSQETLQNVLKSLSSNQVKKAPSSGFEKNGYTFQGFKTTSGKLNGKGKISLNDVTLYVGSLKNNTFDGKGTEFNPFDGGKKIFEGTFKNGKRQGKGTEYANNVKIYEGTFKNGKREGTGTQYSNNHIFYKGSWKGGKKDGKGKLFEKGDLIFQGEFKSDRPCPKAARKPTSLSTNIAYFFRENYPRCILTQSGMETLKRIVIALVFTFCKNIKNGQIDIDNLKEITERIFPQEFREYALEAGTNAFMKNKTMIKNDIILEIIKKRVKISKDDQVKYITGVVEYLLSEILDLVTNWKWIVDRDAVDYYADDEIAYLVLDFDVDDVTDRQVKQEYIPKAEKKKKVEKKERPSPAQSATLFNVGQQKKGGDGNMWKVVEDKNGRKSWKKIKN